AWILPGVQLFLKLITGSKLTGTETIILILRVLLAQHSQAMYYVYNETGKDLGPFEIENLRSKVLSGEIGSDKLVRSASSDQWQPMTSILTEVVTTAASQSKPVIKRYWDAYLTARAVTGFGGIIKTFGVIFGMLIAVAGLIVAVNGRGFDPIEVAIGALVGAFFIAVPFYALGVLVSAQGQVLKASLDTAVNSSPFLTDQDRIQVMSLPSDTQSA
ncbi:MAG TPA: GYF domain-containing protein, partial [Prosthecobacter sp.]|nr:GYF domain-containing protein [Prosthecobacter sp.]